MSMYTHHINQQGISQSYINTLQHINNRESYIRLNKDSEPYRIEKGVRQGYAISTSEPYRHIEKEKSSPRLRHINF